MSFKYEVTQQSATFGDGKVRVIAGFDHESDAAAFASLSRSTYVGVEFEVRPFGQLELDPYPWAWALSGDPDNPMREATQETGMFVFLPRPEYSQEWEDYN